MHVRWGGVRGGNIMDGLHSLCVPPPTCMVSTYWPCPPLPPTPRGKSSGGGGGFGSITPLMVSTKPDDRQRELEGGFRGLGFRGFRV